MKGLKKKFQIGNLSLPNNIIYAPLAGYTDLPFRRIAKKFFAGLVFCEMVKIEALVRDRKKTFNLLDFTKDMHPIGAQICGSNPKVAAQAAKIVEDLGFDIVDLNCGCPVRKVIKDGSGSGMLKTPDLIGEIIHEMTNAVKIPVTIKTRIGWDDNSKNVLDITKIAEKAGAEAITIHGRTKAQGYSGVSDWEWIRKCKEISSNIKVIGNGGLFTVKDIEKIFLKTSCDGVMISRGILSTPWLAEDVLNNIENRNNLFIKKVLLQHIKYVEEYQNEKKALQDIRRISCWYLKSITGIKKLRIAVNKAETAVEAVTLIENFAWEV